MCFTPGRYLRADSCRIDKKRYGVNRQSSCIQGVGYAVYFLEGIHVQDANPYLQRLSRLEVVVALQPPSIRIDGEIQRVTSLDGSVDIHLVIALIARTEHHHVAILAEGTHELSPGASAVMPAFMVILAQAYHERLVLLLGIICHIGQKIANIQDITIRVACQLLLYGWVYLFFTEYQVGFGGHTA